LHASSIDTSLLETGKKKWGKMSTLSALVLPRTTTGLARIPHVFEICQCYQALRSPWSGPPSAGHCGFAAVIGIRMVPMVCKAASRRSACSSSRCPGDISFLGRPDSSASSDRVIVETLPRRSGVELPYTSRCLVKHSTVLAMPRPAIPSRATCGTSETRSTKAARLRAWYPQASKSPSRERARARRRRCGLDGWARGRQDLRKASSA